MTHVTRIWANKYDYRSLEEVGGSNLVGDNKKRPLKKPKPTPESE